MPEPQLIEHRLLDEHVFLLLDPAHAHSAFWKALSGVSIAPTELAGETEALPRLVAIDQLDPAQRDTLLAHLLSLPMEAPRAAAALLATDVCIERLADHLRRRLIVWLPGQGKHLFRYYDPRVFRHFLWMAAPFQLATIFGPITAWTWCDARGQWHRNYPPQEAKPGQTMRVAGLDLSRIGVLERCLKRLRIEVVGFTDDPNNEQARHVNTLLDAALTRGLHEEADLSLYVLQAIRHHPDIHCHPELARRLQAVRDGDSYVGACADLDSDTLSGCALDLSHARKEHA